MINVHSESSFDHADVLEAYFRKGGSLLTYEFLFYLNDRMYWDENLSAGTDVVTGARLASFNLNNSTIVGEMHQWETWWASNNNAAETWGSLGMVEPFVAFLRGAIANSDGEVTLESVQNYVDEYYDSWDISEEQRAELLMDMLDLFDEFPLL